MKICIAIASIGRSYLLQTVQSFEMLEYPEGASLAVIVGDDSKHKAALKLLADYQSEAFTLKVIDVASQNIAHCRNACLDACDADFIAFIDDDEEADPQWLMNLIATAQSEKADAVFGQIISSYYPQVPDWIKTADPVGRMRQRNDGPTNTGSSGNAMVRMAAVREHGLRFDPRYGRTGGEDTDFFLKLNAAGGRLFFTNDAIVRETVLPEKSTQSFFIKRALRSGQSYAAMMLQQKSAFKKIGFYLSAFLKMILGNGMAIAMRPFNRSEAFIWRLKAVMNKGKLRNMINLDLPEIYV
ncbi:MAG: glycosyltransferase [Hyphomicrobiales bacterium]